MNKRGMTFLQHLQIPNSSHYSTNMNPFIVFFITITVQIAFSIEITKSKTISNIFNTDNFPNYKLDIKTGPSDTYITFQHSAESKTQLLKENDGNKGEEDQVVTRIEGKYLIKTDEGILTVKYTADENGYRPKVYWYAANNGVTSVPSVVPQFPPPLKPTNVGYSSSVGPGAAKIGQSGDIGTAVLATLCGRSKCVG